MDTKRSGADDRPSPGGLLRTSLIGTTRDTAGRIGLDVLEADVMGGRPGAKKERADAVIGTR
jgi:hypothetical protein